MYFHGLTNFKSRMMFRHFFITLLFAGCSLLFASGFQSLESGVDARSASMGFTHTAMQDDPVAGFGNPAALFQGPVKTVCFSMNNWIQDMRSGNAGLVISSEHDAFGLSLYYSEIGEIEHRIGPSPTPIGTFSSSDFVLGVGYAREIVPAVSVGLSIRSYYQKIYVDEAWGVGGDLGMTWVLPDQKSRIGIAIQHLGKAGALKQENLELPTVIRVGASRGVAFKKIQGQIQLDAVAEKDAPFHLQAGLELGWAEYFFLRAGYLSGYETRDMTFGLGFRIRHYRLDYALVPFRSGLGDVHMLSILFHW